MANAFHYIINATEWRTVPMKKTKTIAVNISNFKFAFILTNLIALKNTNKQNSYYIIIIVAFVIITANC